jgi:nucleotide-binding universal stress UspA family protein
MLLHVHPPIRSYAGQFFRPRALQAMREAAGRRLLGDAVAMLDGAGIRAGFLSVLGAPAPTVADAARAGGTDAIVMGSPGGGFFARLMFRLLVWQVVRQASVPVHIVGEYGTARVRETARRPWRPAYTH